MRGGEEDHRQSGLDGGGDTARDGDGGDGVRDGGGGDGKPSSFLLSPLSDWNLAGFPFFSFFGKAD